MNTNLTNSIKLSTLNTKQVLQPIIKAKYGPYIDAADGALLRDKNVSDAIKASMSPIVNKTIWKVNLDIEFNKAENSDIKEDFNKIKEKLDFSKMPAYNKDKLQEVIKNLKNRRNWINAISNLEDEDKELKNELNKNITELPKSILTCFGVIRKNGRPVNQLPTFDKAVFQQTTTKQYKDYGLFINAYNVNILPLKEFDNNQQTFNLIKKEFKQNTPEPGQYYGKNQITENFKADEHKIEVLPTWYKKIEDLENSNSYKDKLILNDIYKYINNSVEEDRKLIKDARENHIPNAYPKNIIPFFDQAIFDKALKMNGNEPIMNKYEKCYKDNIIQKYSLTYNEENKATINTEGFYHLDLNKKRKDTSEKRHVNELQFISPNSWCTRSFQGFMHGFAEHYYIILDNNKKVKFGGDYTTQTLHGYSELRMESSTENNNQKFSLDMIKQILKLLKSQKNEIPFNPIHSDLRYLLAKAIIKEKGIDHLEEEYKAISEEFNLPILKKDNLINILKLNTKNYIENDNTLISMEQFKLLKNALNIDGEINEFDEKQLKMINIKRLFETNYNATNNQNPLSINDINNKLKELGYNSIDLTNEHERNETIDTIAKVVIEADLSKRNYIDYKKVYQVVKQIGLTNDEENHDENSFLVNLGNILELHSTYLELNINTICQNLDLGQKITEVELTNKLNDLGFISNDLDNDIFKYASPCYVDFEWDEEKIESEIVNETNVDNNNNNNDIEINEANINKLTGTNSDVDSNDYANIDIENIIIPNDFILEDL